ncbi:MAG: putative methyltransferase [Nevskia sp.]|nr:putative methyltransferase [Nevskia sp.]
MNSKKLSLIALALSLLCGAAEAKNTVAGVDKGLVAAVESPSRPAADRLRDKYRHPLQTLSFFGLKPDMSVVEIWPSAGWYSEILAPYLSGHGHYYAATAAASLPNASDETKKAVAQLRDKFAADPQRFGAPVLTEFRPPLKTAIAPPGSADLVLSFRNVHNWIAGDYEQAAFDAFFAALKPGGTLGIVEHRGKPGETLDEMKKTGYVSEAYVKALAQNAGFQFVAESQVNDNPKDTKDYPKGVWTLPPTYELGDQDRAKYLAIGESDRMTLKFVKPR